MTSGTATRLGIATRWLGKYGSVGSGELLTRPLFHQPPQDMARTIPTVLPPLRDRIRPGVQVLFVGINPGIRSALTGHHFAGFSNRSVFRAMFQARKGPVALGVQPETLGRSAVFVLPNPSGRNANYSYAEMLAAFRALRRYKIPPVSCVWRTRPM